MAPRQQAHAPARRGIVAFLITLAVSAVLIPLVPTRYESHAKLLVQPNEAARLQQVSAPASASGVPSEPEADVSMVAEILASEPLAEGIVTRIGTERILNDRPWFRVALDRLDRWTPGFSRDVVDENSQLSTDEIEQQWKLQTAVKAVMNTMTISSPPNSRMILMHCRAGSANLAQDVGTMLLSAYQQSRTASTSSTDALRRLEETVADQERILREHEDAMRLAKNQMRLITMEGKQDALQQRMTSIETDISRANAELEAARASLLDFIADMDRLPAEAPLPQTAESSGTNDFPGSMAQRSLLELQLKERELVSKYKPGHPLLRNLQQQLSASQDLADSAVEQPVSVANPVRLDVHKWLLEEKAKIAGIEAKLLSLQQIESELHQQIQQINQFEVKAAGLQRNIEMAAGRYMASVQRLDQARLRNSMIQGVAADMAVVQRPTFSVIPASPRFSTLCGFAMVLALVVGLARANFSGRPAGGTRLAAFLRDQAASESKTTASGELELPADDRSVVRSQRAAGVSRHQLELFSGSE